MSDTKTTIEINGTHYDVVTGTAITDQPPALTATVRKPQTLPNQPTKHRTLDGFVQGSRTSALAPVKTTPNRAPVIPKQRTSRPLHIVGKDIKHHKPQKTRTLMRHAVKKPVASSSPKITAASHAIERHTTKPAAQKNTPGSSPFARINRAKITNKSHAIQHYASPHKPLQKQTAHLPVRPAPLVTMPKPGTLGTSPTQDIFAHALREAPLHQEKPPVKQRLHQRIGLNQKAFGISAGVLAFILIAGFFTYQNMPRINLQFAKARAGVSAAIPGYHPSGFSLTNSISAAPGQVTLTFKSNASDSRVFNVTEKTSKWDSNTLLQKYVNNGGHTYQTYQDQGRTIYIYDGSNATWVSGGIWYNVHGNADLTSEQLLNIANSL